MISTITSSERLYFYILFNYTIKTKIMYKYVVLSFNYFTLKMFPELNHYFTTTRWRLSIVNIWSVKRVKWIVKIFSCYFECYKIYFNHVKSYIKHILILNIKSALLLSVIIWSLTEHIIRVTFFVFFWKLLTNACKKL